MSKKYIQNNFSVILDYENVIEKRIISDLTQNDLIEQNQTNLKMCKKYGLKYIWIDVEYKVDITL